MGSSVQNGKLVRTSASQIQQYEACQLQWAYSYVIGIKPPQTFQQGVGENIHAQLETYYKSLGKEQPTHPSAVLLTTKLPAPTDGMLVEYPENKVLSIHAAGVEMAGRIDLVIPGGMLEPGCPTHIIDFKTTGNFKYAKKPHELVTNVQMTVYGKWATQRLGSLEVVYSHAYMGTKETRAEVVSTPVLSHDRVSDEFKRIEGVVVDMAAAPGVIEKAGIEALKGNLKHCWAFGKPCHYQNLCPTFQAALKAKQASRAKDPFSTAFENAVIDTQEKNMPATGINPPDATPHEPLPQHPELHLYISCAPEGTPYSRLEALIEERSKPICAMQKVTDVRQIRFGEGKNMLFASFRENPPTGNVVVSPVGLSAEVLEVLITKATRVTRGF